VLQYLCGSFFFSNATVAWKEGDQDAGKEVYDLVGKRINN